MTAIGIFLCVVGSILAAIDRQFFLPRIVQLAGAVSLLAGMPMLTAGVLVWLWRTMP